ncbi:sulfatase-like hydrolase/transferase [Streptomyces sp. NPDC002668]|uniref:sulfatase-like hydrolase/transferase n=1 Tax=Streptomyces sp. NPDC002668 TaxID=3154422 RepID=UPI00332234ED
MTFPEGHVTTPLCAPSRSSVFSGRYAHNHGVRNNGASAQLDQSTTVQRYLKQAGYRTGLFGKYLNSWPLANNPPHFEDFDLLQPGYVDAQWNVNGTVQTINGTCCPRSRTLRTRAGSLVRLIRKAPLPCPRHPPPCTSPSPSTAPAGTRPPGASPSPAPANCSLPPTGPTSSPRPSAVCSTS